METKRKEFYLSTDVWADELSCHAKSVLAYLSFCANTSGESFPSLRTIAKECSVCRNTARKGIRELQEKGMISIQPRMIVTVSGTRQTSNQYKLLTAKGERKPKPAERLFYPTVEPAPERKEDTEGDGKLDELIERLELESIYRGDPTGKALELAIKELWYSTSFRFKGENIPQKLVRERLKALDVDAVESVIDSIGRYNKSDQAAYMKACIYNAPLKSSAAIASQIIEYKYEHLGNGAECKVNSAE